MVNWSKVELASYEARKPIKEDTTEGVAPGTEAALHDAILEECNRRRWVVVRSRMDVRATTGPGTPDFLIFATFPSAYMVEAKTRTGKLSTAQRGFIMQVERLGWTVHVVRSLQQFIEAVARPAQLPDVAQRILDRAHQATGNCDRLLTGNDDWVPGVSLADLELILKQEVPQ